MLFSVITELVWELFILDSQLPISSLPSNLVSATAGFIVLVILLGKKDTENTIQ